MDEGIDVVIEEEEIGLDWIIDTKEIETVTDTDILFIKGDKGEPGEKGETGEKGEQGNSGVYIGNDEPTDNSNVWIIPNGEAIEYQEKLIAGDNIIIEGNVISSTGGSGGTSDYSELENKPKINNIELIGNKNLDDLGIQDKSSLEADVKSFINSNYIQSLFTNAEEVSF